MRDTGHVKMLSTKHASTMVPKNWQQSQTFAPGQQVTTNQPSTSTTQDQPQSSNIKRRSRKATEKPLSIIAYNNAKAGIDSSDQMDFYVATMQKGVKWYKKLGIELILEVAVVNAWVMYKRVSHKKILITSFAEKLAANLIQIDTAGQPQPTSLSNIYLLLTKLDDNGRKSTKAM